MEDLERSNAKYKTKTLQYKEKYTKTINEYEKYTKENINFKELLDKVMKTKEDNKKIVNIND